MSTRGSIGFIHNNEYSGVYNHSDSYPSGLGDGVVEFCRQVADWPAFIANFAKVRFVGSGHKPSPEEIEQNKKWANLSVSNRSYEDLYCLLRELQGEAALYAIQAGEVTLLEDSSEFIKESLFCEFAYVLNLDELAIEFYQGFQKSPQPDNRFGTSQSDGYYPCRKVGSFPLTAIPDKWEAVYFPEETEAE